MKHNGEVSNVGPPKQNIKDKLSSYFDVDPKDLLRRKLPITQWLPTYRVTTFFQDLLAGFTVSLTEVPQAISYASIAGLSPAYGLYSGFIGGFVYALFGSCKDINIGPTSILSLMIQNHVTKFGPDAAVLITFLSGIIIFLLGVFNLGFVIEFFSYPIIAGFTCAASVEIASTQLNNFFGISGKADEFLEAWEQFSDKIGETKKWDAILAVISLICLVVLREIKRFGTLRYRKDWSRRHNIFGITIYMIFLARNAIVIIIATSIAYRLGDDCPFKLTGNVTAGFPPFEAPHFSTNFNGTDYSFNDMASELGASIAFIPLVAILEGVSIAKTFSDGKPIDATQEILTLGIGNTLSSFVRSMPITGSFTRSAINNASGVRTPLAGIFTSIVSLLAIAFLTPTFYYVPKATMSAVVICAMGYLFEYKAFSIMWKNKKMDLIPFLVTFLCGLFLSLEYGILIGIGVNLLFVLFPTARPKIKTVSRQVTKREGEVFVIKPVDTLYFPAAEYLRERVLQCEGKDAIVVVDGKYVRKIDVTVARSIVVFSREMTKRGNKVLFWHFKASVAEVCIGMDESLRDCFKMGELEDIIEDQQPAGDSGVDLV